MFLKLTLTVFVLGMLLSCKTSPPAKNQVNRRFEYSHRQMGTLFRIVLYAADSSKASAAAKAAFARVDFLNDILSDYKQDSELSLLSATAGTQQKVQVSTDLWQVLKKSIEMSVKTNGAFDITVGPFVQLWRRARRQHELPTQEAIEKARQSVGYQYVVLFDAEQAVQLTRPGMRLDAGGVGKGYAVDEAMKVLQKHEIRSALVDGGGNILVSDAPPGKKGWQVEIGIIPGEASSNEAEITHMAVASSGDVYQFIEFGGKRYSHIVDPRTGLGLTQQIEVSVLAHNGITSDLLSTSVSVLGPKAGLQLVEATRHAAAFISVRNEQAVQKWKSKRMKKIVPSR